MDYIGCQVTNKNLRYIYLETWSTHVKLTLDIIYLIILFFVNAYFAYFVL